MYNNKHMKTWKIAQINYFKQYLKTFNKGSKEYTLIKQGIERLENSL